LLLTYSANNKWLKTISAAQVQFNAIVTRRVTICLRIVVFLLFLGHGWLNLIEKKSLVDQYYSLGLSNATNIAHLIGGLEILAAVSVLIRPIHSLLIILFIWKMTSELFYPHWEIFEFIERGGSYGAILALWFLTKSSANYSFIVRGTSTTTSVYL